ncbi:MAG: glycosyltransferase family 4 protein [Methanosphaera sp.]|nr:glycosyltransferase family 4 protein [Methanosphaera sp.]
MKIAMISNLYPPNILGGAEIIVEKLVRNIADKDHEVVVITCSIDDEERIQKEDNITIYHINKTKLYPVYKQTEAKGYMKPLWHLFDLWNRSCEKRIIEIVKKEKCDIIHINNFKGLSLSCFEVGKKLNIPVVFESHDFSLICPRANLIRGNDTLCTEKNQICEAYVKIQRKLLDDNVDLMIAPSNFMIDKYTENDFFAQTRCIKIPLGIDFERKKTTKDYDCIDFTYIGSLGKHKGVDTLINAFKEIDDENIRLHLIGKGYDEEEFKQLAGEDKRIIFHGFVDNRKIKEYYRLSNVIIIPSICYDNSPLVIYESFTTATPVIGSNIGGIPELIDDGKNGYLFEAGDVQDLKDKLLKIINDKNSLIELEENAYDSIPEKSLDIMTDKTIEAYRQLL